MLFDENLSMAGKFRGIKNAKTREENEIRKPPVPI